MDNNIKQNTCSDNEKEIEQIYEWIDSIPLSRVKKNIARDFCDGVLIAEVVKHHIPKLVEIHNYSAASSATQKNYNWVTLNQKVFKKLGFQLTKNEIHEIINCKQGAIENLLKRLNKHIQKYMASDMSLSKNLNGEINLSGEDNEGNRNSKRIKESYGEYDNYDRNKLLKAVRQKDAQIDELKNIVDILEMKLNNSSEIQHALEKRISQLKDILKGYGHI